MYYAGIDIGSSFAKAVVTDGEGNLLGKSCRRSGLSFEAVARKILEEARADAGIGEEPLSGTVSTGVGRHNCDIADFAKSEISCLAKAGFHLVQAHHSVVDIGGQDNKIVHLGDDGKIVSFKMNRKCAAGTGAFLEEIANRLGLGPQEMNDLATRATKAVKIGSYCTVFTGTEIIHHIRNGEAQEEIVRGVYESVVKRILEMDTVGRDIVVSGGVVANHPVLVSLLEEKLETPVLVPAEAQFTGAIGAAIYGISAHQKRERTS